MNEIARILLFIVSCVFAQNVVFVRLLGCCEITEDRRVETAVGYGAAVAVVMTLAAAGSWMVLRWVLEPLNAGYLDLTACVLMALIAAWIVERAVSALFPKLAEGLDGCLLGIAANCAVLGIALINLEADCGLGTATLNGLFGGLSFLVAVVLMAGVQERLETSRVPESLRGLPITLISASLIALAFMGFLGL